MLSFWNDRYAPMQEIALPLNDGAILFGALITDRFRTFGKRYFRLKHHLHRFEENAKLAKIPLRLSTKEISQIVHHLLEENRKQYPNSPDFSLVLLATPGPVSSLSTVPTEPTLIAYQMGCDLPRYRCWFEKGVRLLPNLAVINSETMNPQIKHRNRLHWWIAEQNASNQNNNSLLLYCWENSRNLIDSDSKSGNEKHDTISESGTCSLRTQQAFVRETAISNFFSVIRGRVISPPVKTILRGIAWEVIRELCSKRNIPFIEQEYTIPQLISEADECFISNSSVGIVGVFQLGDRTFSWPGKVSKMLSDDYSDLVGIDIASQILGNKN